MRLFSIFKDILGNLVKGPVTRNYPAEVRDPFPGERGKLVIDEKACIFCGMCAKKCPANALTVTRQPKEWKFDVFLTSILWFDNFTSVLLSQLKQEIQPKRVRE